MSSRYMKLGCRYVTCWPTTQQAFHLRFKLHFIPPSQLPCRATLNLGACWEKYDSCTACFNIRGNDIVKQIFTRQTCTRICVVPRQFQIDLVNAVKRSGPKWWLRLLQNILLEDSWENWNNTPAHRQVRPEDERTSSRLYHSSALSVDSIGLWARSSFSLCILIHHNGLSI